MDDKRPIVYVVRAIKENNIFYNHIPLAYFVSKARLQTEKKFYTEKGEIIKSYEFDLYPYELDISQYNLSPTTFVDIGSYVKDEFVSFDYKTCHEHVVNLNKKLLENCPYKEPFIPIAKQLESVYISEEEILGIENEEEKGQE